TAVANKSRTFRRCRPYDLYGEWKTARQYSGRQRAVYVRPSIEIGLAFWASRNSPPREEGWTRSGRGGRSHRTLVVSDHPSGAEVGFAEIFLMPHPLLLTRRGLSVRLVLRFASPSEHDSDKNTDDINPCHHGHKEQHGRDLR